MDVDVFENAFREEESKGRGEKQEQRMSANWILRKQTSITNIYPSYRQPPLPDS